MPNTDTDQAPIVAREAVTTPHQKRPETVDLENALLQAVEAMAVPSLSPERFEDLHKIIGELRRNRRLERTPAEPEHEDLIKRLCEAPKGSREMDAEVAEALGWVKLPDNMTKGPYWWFDDQRRKRTTPTPPPFTTSLDAILAEVPEGAIVSLSNSRQRRGLWGFDLRLPHQNEWRFEAKTAPLALCAALVWAKEAEK